MENSQSRLRSHVHLMGEILGDAIRAQYGKRFFQKIETIRTLSKSARAGNAEKKDELLKELHELKDNELLPVTRAFSQFLNLANIAEQYHASENSCDGDMCLRDTSDELFIKLKEQGLSPEEIRDAAEKLEIELVLTAHPTEVTRRTQIQKYTSMTKCFEKMQQASADTESQEQKQYARKRLEELVWQSWHTDEFRHERPTPVDEAKWGLATVEHSLWSAIPEFFRILDSKLYKHTGYHLSANANPIRLASWMGGDRDGNPNVTADITRKTLIFGRLVGVRLYLKTLRTVITELSMSICSPALREKVGAVSEPYRAILNKLRNKLKHTRDVYECLMAGDVYSTRDIIKTSQELIEPLQLCYDSLSECGLSIIANGLLLDLLRRVKCFGLGLVRLDIRQESERHSLAISELTQYLNLGDYNNWAEQDKLQFLLKEIQNIRPLLPLNWKPSAETQEVLDTCKVIAAESPDSFRSYVISMAQQPSDVLAVILLLKECGCTWNMPVVPLFETLDDLNNAGDSVNQLLNIPWYKEYTEGNQMVMIGYSDSSKDAGQLAAAWAQYRAMESITALCKKEDIKLTLFHGRGGTVGRGGLPAHDAILSQPPGSVDFRLRVTEQGEMIRFKYGFPKIAVQNLLLYASATLEASMLPPPSPNKNWRNVMSRLSQDSLQEYRKTIREEPDFVPYFRALTPEQELGKLLIGSRPPKRRASGGVETLRAIPWIFAWTQCRLMLPVWLGAGVALQNIVDDGDMKLLQTMMSEWPFFRTRIEMFEMVFLKTDIEITRYYEDLLVPEELKVLGASLRDKQEKAMNVIMKLNNNKPLMSSQPWEQKAIQLRNPYADPLHMLQAELLKRIRTYEIQRDSVEQAMMMTIAGIAAGMRNTG